MSNQEGSGILGKIKNLFKKKEVPKKSAPVSVPKSRQTKSSHSSTTLSYASTNDLRNFTPRTGKSDATTTEYEKYDSKNRKAEAQQQRRQQKRIQKAYAPSGTTLSFASTGDISNFTPRTGKTSASTTDYEKIATKDEKAAAQQQRREMRKASVNANDKVGSWLARGSSKKTKAKK